MSTQSPSQQLIGIGRSIGRGFANLLNFRGRDSTGQFWPYALAVIVIVSFGAAIAMDAPMRAAMQAMFDYVAVHPDQGSARIGTNGASVTIHGFPPELTSLLRPLILSVGGMLLATVVLLAAAVIRRLHDANKPVYWGVLPVLFAGVGLWLFPTFFGPEPPSGGVFFVLFANNVLYIISLIRLIVLLAGPSATSSEATP